MVGPTPGRYELIDRMARCWREMRRGPATMIVRERLFGAPPDAIDPVHVDVLELLEQRDDWRMNELATALHVDPATVTRTIQRMEECGLATRGPHDHDGRVVTVHVTPIGRERYETVVGRRRETVGQILARFDPAEQRQLVELVERFLASANDHVGLAPPAAHGSAAAVAG